MICPKCKRNIRDDSIYCSKCGVELKSYKENSSCQDSITTTKEENTYKDVSEKNSNEILDFSNKVTIEKDDNFSENKKEENKESNGENINSIKKNNNNKIIFIVICIIVLLSLIGFMSADNNDDIDNYSNNTEIKYEDTDNTNSTNNTDTIEENSNTTEFENNTDNGVISGIIENVTTQGENVGFTLDYNNETVIVITSTETFAEANINEGDFAQIVVVPVENSDGGNKTYWALMFK